jgi:hypothetical protein
MDEEDQFRALVGFLERFESDVSGRSAESIDAEMEAKIRDLAAGTLEDNEREQVLLALSSNRAGLELLASCLRN